MKLSTRRDALFAQLQTVTRAASTRSAVQALSGVQIQAAERRRSSCAPPTWRSACACRSRARSCARAPSCCRRGCSSTSSARCRPTRSRSSCAPPSRTSSSSPAPRRSTSARCASRTSRRFPEPDGDERVDVPGPAFVETVLKVAPLRVARRDAPGAHRHPRLGRRARSCGWSRPTPTAWPSRRRSSRRRSTRSFEANVPARALQELTRIVQHGRRGADRRLAAREPGRVRGRPASCCPRG